MKTDSALLKEREARIDAAGAAMYYLLNLVMDDDATREQYAEEWASIVDYVEKGVHRPTKRRRP